MKANKLKFLPAIIYCFLIALWSEAQSMDSQLGIEKETSHRTTHFYGSPQEDIHNTAMEALEVDSYDTAPTHHSWLSYLISPINTTTKIAKAYLSIVSQNPKLSIFLIASHILPVTVDALCACYCFIPCTPEPNSYVCHGNKGNIMVGHVQNQLICGNMCVGKGYGFLKCESMW